MVVSPAYLRLLIFLPEILIPAHAHYSYVILRSHSRFACYPNNVLYNKKVTFENFLAFITTHPTWKITEPQNIEQTIVLKCCMTIFILLKMTGSDLAP